MAISPERRKLLLEEQALLAEEEVLLSRGTTKTPDSVAGRIGQAASGIGKEIAGQAPLTPPALSQIGRAIKEKTPKALRPGLDIAAETIKGQVFQPVAGAGSKLTVDQPGTVSRAALLGVAPVASLAGLGTRLATGAAVRDPRVQQSISSILGKAQENISKQQARGEAPVNPLVGAGSKAGKRFIKGLTTEEVTGGIELLSELVGGTAALKATQGTKLGRGITEFVTTNKGALKIPGKGLIDKKILFKEINKNVSSRAQFSREVRGSVLARKNELGASITDSIDDFVRTNPTQVESLQVQTDDLLALANQERDVKRVLGAVSRRTKKPLFREIIKDSGKASDLTMTDLQDIRLAIEQHPPIKTKLSNKAFDKLTFGEEELLNFADEIKQIQASKIPGLSDDRKAFSQFMDSFRENKGVFKKEALEKTVRRGFTDKSAETIEELQGLVPADMFNKITAFGKSVMSSERNKALLTRLLRIAVGSAVGFGTFQAVKSVGGGFGDTGPTQTGG